MEPIIIITGGAEDIPDEMIPTQVRSVRKACSIGYRILSQCGGTCVDAVEAAICFLEEDGCFNAAKGGSLTADGEIELDASIMQGECLQTGAVSVVKDMPHPISVARMVMEKTPHTLLVGEGAERFADSMGVPRVDPCELVTEWARTELDMWRNCQKLQRCDSVGAVAMDCRGKIASGSSTGGLVGRLQGRSSDCSQIGAAVYCDDRYGGAACSGHGESIIKLCLGFNTVRQLQCGKSPQQAVQNTVNEVEEMFCKRTGAIVLSKCGNVGVFFTSHRMPWAYTKGKKMYYGAKPGELNVADCCC